MRHFKFCGMIALYDQFHQITHPGPGEHVPKAHEIAPITVTVNITNPPPTRSIGVPQYGLTVVGNTASYNPPTDCSGNFMSSKFKPNNNCYAYGVDIASNSYPQPGRASGNLITSKTLNGPSIRQFSEQDGLVFAGTSMEEMKTFAAQQAPGSKGHFAALMISPPNDMGWTGDYHWARCDDPINYASWSQKDGRDQITNFDFAGQPIANPARANWTVNLGPSHHGGRKKDLVVDYIFYCFMFVPSTGVKII